jgi:hypothetical protein
VKNHFDYLLAEQDADFFQKVAVERAMEDIKPCRVVPQVIEKTASAMDKFASRIDRDIEILRAATTDVMSLGMTKRACQYLARLADDQAVNDVAYQEAFEKMAAAAIDHDIDASCVALTTDMPESFQRRVFVELSKVGAELVKVAGLAGAIGEFGHLGGAVRGVEHAAEGMSAAKNVERAAQPTMRGYRGAEGASSGATVKPMAAPKAPKASAAAPAGKASLFEKLRHPLRSSAAANLEGQANVGRIAVKNLEGERANLVARHSASSGADKGAIAGRLEANQKKLDFSKNLLKGHEGALERATTPKGVDMPKAPEAPKSNGAAEAAEAAKAPKAPSPPPAAKEAPPSEPKASKPKEDEGATSGGEGEGEEAAGPVHHTFKKFMAGKKMSSAEHKQLIKAGLIGVAAHRTLTGRDLVTGDKNS